MYVFKPKGSSFYRGRYRLSEGPKWYDIPLRVEQRHVAEEKLRRYVRELEEEMAGLLGPKSIRDAAKRPLTERCAEYLEDLAARNRSEAHLVHVRNGR